MLDSGTQIARSEGVISTGEATTNHILHTQNLSPATNCVSRHNRQQNLVASFLASNDYCLRVFQTRSDQHSAWRLLAANALAVAFRCNMIRPAYNSDLSVAKSDKVVQEMEMGGGDGEVFQEEEK